MLLPIMLCLVLFLEAARFILHLADWRSSNLVRFVAQLLAFSYTQVKRRLFWNVLFKNFPKLKSATFRHSGISKVVFFLFISHWIKFLGASMGPVISEGQYNKIWAYIDDAKAQVSYSSATGSICSFRALKLLTGEKGKWLNYWGQVSSFPPR